MQALWRECGEDLDRLLAMPIERIWFRLGLAAEWSRAKKDQERARAAAADPARRLR